MVPSIFEVRIIALENASCFHLRSGFDGQDDHAGDVGDERGVLQERVVLERFRRVHARRNEAEQTGETKDVLDHGFVHPFEIVTDGIILIVVDQGHGIVAKTLLAHQCHHRRDGSAS